VEENQSIGTVVGTLSSTDADSSEFTYSLVSGDTDEFSVNSNQLLTAAVFDYESTTSYSVEVRSDDADGGGLNVNSATFYIKDTTDTKYWDGDSWEDNATWLATTHNATTDGSEVVWSDAIDLPAWTDAHGYEVKAKAIDKTNNTLEGTAISFTYDTTGPTISGGVLASDDAYVTVTFDEGVYNANGGSGALETSGVKFSGPFLLNE